MTEMLRSENPIRLTKAGHLFLTNPCERTLIRWSRIGLGGVKLETFMAGRYSLSRMARSTKDAISIFEKLNAAKADLVSLRETLDTTNAMGRFAFTLMAAIATLEREQTSERTRDAMLSHQANGRRMSDCCPYGWRRRSDEPAMMEKDDHEQGVIARIIHERESGRKLREICRILEGEGFTCRGGPWYHQTIKNIIGRAGALEAG